MEELNTITTLVSSVGFPILMCLIMGYYIKYITDKHSEEVKMLTESVNKLAVSMKNLEEYIKEEKKC